MRPTTRIVSASMVAAFAGSVGAPGGAGVFPAVIELSTLNGTTGFEIPGVNQYDLSGCSVASAGDINGDGIDDFVIGARSASGYTGAVYVVYGKSSGTFPTPFSLATLNGANGFRIDGTGAQDGTGFCVNAAGDFNGDGVDDLIIGAPSAAPGGRNNAGSSFVVFGKHAATAGNFPAVLPLSTLNGANGLRLNGVSNYDDSGASVARAGDLNGDGIDDIVIGAFDATAVNPQFGAGISYVVFGKNTAASGNFPAVIELSTLNGMTGFRLDGTLALDRAGRSVAPAGDVNGDGFDDLVIGAYFAAPGGSHYAGSTYVVYGKSTMASGAFPAVFALSNLNGANGFRINGSANDTSGHSVAGAGDVNDDGISDIIIGAPYMAEFGQPTLPGAAYVVLGKNTATSGQFPAVFALSTLTGANGFKMAGVANYDRTGYSVSSAGDINGDGIDDVIVGANRATAGGQMGAGSSFVVFGRHTATAGNFPATLALAALDGTKGFRMNGTPDPIIDGGPVGEHSGWSVAGIGDINHDGVGEIVIGAARTVRNGHTNSGTTYVVYGGGAAAPCPGDTNGDGRVDFFDLNIVLSQFGMTGPGLIGDLNHDGVCNFVDLNIVLSFFGTTC